MYVNPLVKTTDIIVAINYNLYGSKFGIAKNHTTTRINFTPYIAIHAIVVLHFQAKQKIYMVPL